MKFILFLILSLAAVPKGLGSEYADTISDGPYIFRTGRNFDAVWIDNGSLIQKKLRSKGFAELQKKYDLKFRYGDLLSIFFYKPDYLQSYRNADSIAAISDIHGAYKGYINLLQSQGIIDNNLDWSFGKGHLVVLGDIFDRGDKVTELLWHLFGLEKQAEKAGGKVHVLLGNHELMTFAGELGYTNKKYIRVAEISGKKYSDLYSDSSILGRWIRFKPVIATINDMIFVHAGISEELMMTGISFAEMNRLFVQMLVEKAVESQNDISNLELLTDVAGPVWYRGFFSSDFDQTSVDAILNYYGKKRIIVGHTTILNIRAAFHNRIIAIDAGLGNDMPGEMLIIKGDDLYRATTDGKRQKL
ncbi:MAG TPA: metallophosphoesterase [Bacteroidales bacterium]|nr:metallophosphoesterase [Bacteroidales bacterium]